LARYALWAQGPFPYQAPYASGNPYGYGSPYGYGYGYDSPYGYGYGYGYLPIVRTGPSAVRLRGRASGYTPSTDREASSNDSARATIELRVPGNARVWFNGKRTRQGGRVRDYYTSELRPGKEYAYDLRVRWRDRGGKAHQEERTVRVRAGERINLDLTRGAAAPRRGR
jgi:uncharacterized protein (TIGR03000 family)